MSSSSRKGNRQTPGSTTTKSRATTDRAFLQDTKSIRSVSFQGDRQIYFVEAILRCPCSCGSKKTSHITWIQNIPQKQKNQKIEIGKSGLRQPTEHNLEPSSSPYALLVLRISNKIFRSLITIRNDRCLEVLMTV